MDAEVRYVYAYLDDTVAFSGLDDVPRLQDADSMAFGNVVAQWRRAQQRKSGTEGAGILKLNGCKELGHSTMLGSLGLLLDGPSNHSELNTETWAYLSYCNI